MIIPAYDRQAVMSHQKTPPAQLWTLLDLECNRDPERETEVDSEPLMRFDLYRLANGENEIRRTSHCARFDEVAV